MRGNTVQKGHLVTSLAVLVGRRGTLTSLKNNPAPARPQPLLPPPCNALSRLCCWFLITNAAHRRTLLLQPHTRHSRAQACARWLCWGLRSRKTEKSVQTLGTPCASACTHPIGRQRPAFALVTGHIRRARTTPGQPQGRESTSHHASRKPQLTQCHTPNGCMQQLCDVHCRRKQSSPGCLCVTARTLLVFHSQRQGRRHDAGQTTIVTGEEEGGVSTRSHAFPSMPGCSNSNNLQWTNGPPCSGARVDSRTAVRVAQPQHALCTHAYTHTRDQGTAA